MVIRLLKDIDRRLPLGQDNSLIRYASNRIRSYRMSLLLICYFSAYINKVHILYHQRFKLKNVQKPINY